MATALGIAADRANRRTFATYYDITVVVCCCIDVYTLDTSAHLDGRPVVVRITIVGKVDTFDVVGPDR